MSIDIIQWDMYEITTKSTPITGLNTSLKNKKADIVLTEFLQNVSNPILSKK
ncbi:MAG: hypothetical protein ACI8Y7_000459 [Candidatus Woesearchaeota archaeon]|jgi:hypothetical protein